MPGPTRRGIPRFRVEERRPDRAAYIVGFADTPLQVSALLAVGESRLLRDRAVGEVVAVDQETDADVICRRVGDRDAPDRGAG